MVEPSHGAGLGQIGLVVVGIGDAFRMRHLNRHAAAELVVVGQVDAAEAPFAQHALDAIAADRRRQI
jgi:hypothetical protein